MGRKPGRGPHGDEMMLNVLGAHLGRWRDRDPQRTQHEQRPGDRKAFSYEDSVVLYTEWVWRGGCKCGWGGEE